MCVVSNVSDNFMRQRPDTWPNGHWPPIDLEGMNQLEINRLRAEIVQLKKELQEARAQDIADGNPDCHMEDKVTIIKGLAKMLDVDLADVFEGHK